MEEEDSDEGQGGNSERRSAPRITARSLVEVRLPSWEALRSVYTVNLSQGGMRLSVGARAPLGADVDIILTLPNGTRLHLPGKVAHLGDGGDIGVRFDNLPERTQLEIRQYVDDLSAGRTPSSKTKSIPPGVLIKKKS
jgi:Tfp pilus assembly protein PilZ